MSRMILLAIAVASCAPRAGSQQAAAISAARAPDEGSRPPREVTADPPRGEPPAPSADRAREEAAAPSEPAPGALFALAVPGHKDAVAAMPAAGRRPLVVATHGAGGTPEAQCAYWKALTASAEGEAPSAFILCPRGVTMDVYAPPEARGWFYPDHPALEREVRAAIAALAARFPDRVDVDRAVFAGFSQGATMGALAFSRAPSPFVAMVMVEGGSGEWAMYNARAFHAGGGRKAIFACGRASCAEAAEKSASYLRRAGVAARVIDATGAGHTPSGVVRDRLAAALPWLLEGDERFTLPAR